MRLLETRGLNFHYPSSGQNRLEVLNDVNISLETGEILTFLGPSGCGKSTLLNLLSGFLKAPSGSVLHNNRELIRPFPAGQMIFQDSLQLLPWLTVAENILFPLCRSPFPGVKPRPGKDLQEKLSSLLDVLGLEAFSNYHPSRLSGGMKQRCALGRALMADPEILFMDEPFGSLDAPARKELRNLLLTLWEERHFSVIFVTHDISEAITLSDRILMFRQLGERVKDVSVPLARPRNRQSREFKDLEWRLYSSLADSGRTL